MSILLLSVQGPGYTASAINHLRSCNSCTLLLDSSVWNSYEVTVNLITQKFDHDGKNY